MSTNVKKIVLFEHGVNQYAVMSGGTTEDGAPDVEGLFILTPDADGYFQMDEGPYAHEMLLNNPWTEIQVPEELAVLVWSLMDRLHTYQMEATK